MKNNKMSYPTDVNIHIIGAGGIVKDAHLPAYELAGYPVAGIFDIDIYKAEELKNRYSISATYPSVQDMVKASNTHTIFDIAVPGSEVLSILRLLPDHSVVLIQKPMGNTLEEGLAIRSICREKKLKAGVNFQLRYAPFILKAREIITSGSIGELCDIEINVNVFTPWHLWTFLYKAPRVEILYHSIHYIDLIRSFIGNPQKVYAKTTKHPDMSDLASVRSNIIMDYGDFTRAHINTNHTHKYGEKHQHAYIKLEGTKGAIRMEMGLLKNYPEGLPDVFEHIQLHNNTSSDWVEEKVEGTWFPHSFIGSMGEMVKVVNDRSYIPDNSVEDCIHTMSCVEAAYESSQSGGIIFRNL